MDAFSTGGLDRPKFYSFYKSGANSFAPETAPFLASAAVQIEYSLICEALSTADRVTLGCTISSLPLTIGETLLTVSTAEEWRIPVERLNGGLVNSIGRIRDSN